MTPQERKTAIICILATAFLMGLWIKSLHWAHARGMRDERLKIIKKALDENGKPSKAPLLLYGPWTPERELNINPTRYRRGDL